MSPGERRSSLDTEGTLYCRSTRISASFDTVLRALSPLHSAWRNPDGCSLLGSGTTATLSASGTNRFESIREQAATLFESVESDGPPTARPRLFGGFAFHAEPSEPWSALGAAMFQLPRLQAVSFGDETWLTATHYGPDATTEHLKSTLETTQNQIETLSTNGSCETPPVPGVRSSTPHPTREQWREQVESAIQTIETTRLQKVVVAQALEVDLENPIPRIFGQLQRRDDGIQFSVSPAGGPTFFGSTPERLAHHHGSHVDVDALAGTVSRGDSAQETDTLAGALEDSEKNRHEHQFVSEAIQESLEELPARVEVGERAVRELGTVQHLHTPISARFQEPTHVLEVLEALHPTPAVGGTPRAEALEAIRQTESLDRGWYAAPVGHFDADGEGCFAVAIRSGRLEAETATLFAGNGIVADSDPEEELEELTLKYQPMLDTLSGDD